MPSTHAFHASPNTSNAIGLNGRASHTHAVFYFKHGAAREDDQKQHNPEPRH
ncbi:hypothetical protein CLU84_2436 [Comamonas sp. 26]|nr:hypothetical protein CLU84_2436 [Comamonas sp. 26]